MLILGGRTKSLGHSQSLCLETEVTGMITTAGSLTSLHFCFNHNTKWKQSYRFHIYCCQTQRLWLWVNREVQDLHVPFVPVWVCWCSLHSMETPGCVWPCATPVCRESWLNFTVSSAVDNRKSKPASNRVCCRFPKPERKPELTGDLLGIRSVGVECVVKGTGTHKNNTHLCFICR